MEDYKLRELPPKHTWKKRFSKKKWPFAPLKKKGQTTQSEC